MNFRLKVSKSARAKLYSVGVIKGAAALFLALGSSVVYGQSPLFGGEGRSSLKPAAVEYLFPEQANVPTGKPTVLALHFRVAPGLHINSHSPKDEFLIPTTFSIPRASGVRLESADYPAGVQVTLPLAPRTPLNVYAGEFILRAHIVAESGDHLVEAKLRYQACDENACMPPKTITVAIDVIGQ